MTDVSVPKTADYDVSLESLVAQAADEFLERQKRGERPDVEEYAARYPQAAEVLRKVLASLQFLRLSACAEEAQSGAKIEGVVTGTLGDFRIRREIGRGGMGSSTRRNRSPLGGSWR